MKKSEVVAMSNEELILELARLVTWTRCTKAGQRTGNWICQELASRKVIDDAASLYEHWDDMYTW